MRGYLLKSSLGPNCFGFTKIETTTGEHCDFAASTRDAWPRCRAPIVGTRPRMRSACLAARPICFIQETVRTISMCEWASSGASRSRAMPYGSFDEQRYFDWQLTWQMLAVKSKIASGGGLCGAFAI